MLFAMAVPSILVAVIVMGLVEKDLADLRCAEERKSCDVEEVKEVKEESG